MTENKIDKTREENLPDYRQVGIYEAEGDSIKSQLKLYRGRTDCKHVGAGFRRFVREGEGDPYYFADVRFSTQSFGLNARVNFEANVSIHYGCHDLPGIFRILKYNEEHIENLLVHSEFIGNWKANRDIMKCIFSLEEQVEKTDIV